MVMGVGHPFLFTWNRGVVRVMHGARIFESLDSMFYNGYSNSVRSVGYGHIFHALGVFL